MAPIFNQPVEILKLVKEISVMLLHFEQGKNRQVAQFLLDDRTVLSLQSTQPSADSTAHTISKERDDGDVQFGKSVVYKTFLGSDLPWKYTSILFSTAEYELGQKYLHQKRCTKKVFCFNFSFYKSPSTINILKGNEME